MRRLLLTAIGGLLVACSPAPAQVPPAGAGSRPTPTPTPPAPQVSLTRPPLPTPTVVPTPAPPRARPPLQPALDAVAAQHPGSIGVVVTALGPEHQSASVHAERRFRSASLYKLFVMQTAADSMDAGDLDPDETLTLTAAVAMDDPYTDLPVGTQTSVDCALQTMLQMSGNSAADVLVDRLGLPAINARMLDLLSGQQHADRLPAPLPLGVRVAHKTGELPNLRHDAGIVYAPSGAYVFVAMVQDAPSEAAARGAIVDLSRAAMGAPEPQPAGLTLAYGLPPRLAREVFAVPDARG